jgi:hypothetical protein
MTDMRKFIILASSILLLLGEFVTALDNGRLLCHGGRYPGCTGWLRLHSSEKTMRLANAIF